MKINFPSTLPAVVIGRLASIVTRYHDKADFEEAVRRTRPTTADPGIKPSDPTPQGKIVYSAPVGSGKSQIEIRLIFKDPEAEPKRRKKAKTSRYYQVAGKDAAALQAKAQEIIAFYALQNVKLSYLGGEGHTEQDEPDPLLRDQTQRIILADESGDTQLCMLVNPPFPRDKADDVPFLGQPRAWLALVAGLGLLLLGSTLLRQR